MKKHYKLSRFSLLVLMAFTLVPFIHAATPLCGDVTTNTTLSLADSPYEITCDYVVKTGVTLTIEAGVQIDFENQYSDLVIEGTLTAIGSDGNLIRFYSSNGTGGGSVYFKGTSTNSTVSYALVENLGISSSSAHDVAFRIAATTVAISNTTFMANTQGDVRAHPNGVAGFAETNSLLSIGITGDIAGDATWSNADAGGFYYELLQDITVPENTTLTIDPGVEINFPSVYRDLKVHGTLIAEGTSGNNIRFYSDNGDGGGSVFFKNTSTGSSISHALVENFGISSSSAYDAGFRIEAANVAVSNTTFTGNTQGDVRAHPNGVSGFDNTNSLTHIEITGTMVTDAVWPDADASGFYYELKEDITVPENTTLTISPGVDINFPDQYKDLVVEGTLKAEGTATDSIRFYSDNVVGGGSVYFKNASDSSSVSYAIVETLGISTGSAHDAGFRIGSTVVSVANSTFRSNTRGDVRAHPNGVSGFANTNSLTHIKITGTMTTSAVWPDADADGFYYELLGDITVPENATLTIDPGVDVNLPDQYIDLIIEGTLTADGTPADNIRFYGANANVGGGSLYFKSVSSNSSVSYALVENLGINSGSAHDAAFRIAATTVSVANTTFTGNIQGDIRAHPNGVSGFANTNNLTDIEITGSMTANAVWPDADANGFYYELQEDITVPQNTTLTIDPGVDINFPNENRDLIVNGTLTANGTNMNKIRFYSDNTIGGGSVYFKGTSINSSVSHAIVEELGIDSGSASDAGFRIDASEVDIENTLVQNCKTGISIRGASMPTIKCSIIKDNATGIHITNGEPVLLNNEIRDNSDYGINNESDNAVSACNTLWGDASGPGDMENRVSDNVVLDDPACPLETCTISVTDAEDNKVKLRSFPNPFNEQTTIEYTLEEAARVTLYISDLHGRKVETLLRDEQNVAGVRQVLFDARAYPSGIYYYTIQVENYIKTEKMNLIK